MPKVYKRILTPLFFAVVALVILSISAFADGETGVPFVSINGASPVPITSNLSFSSDDEVIVTSSGIISFGDFTIPSGVTFTIAPNMSVLFTNGRMLNYGVLNIYGTLSCNQVNNNSSTSTVSNFTGAVINLYYGSVTRINEGSSGGTAIGNAGGIINFNGGTVEGITYGILNNSVVNLYSGNIIGTTPIGGSGIVNSDGITIDSDTGEITFNPSFYDSITEFVTGSTSWISSFINAITSNLILLLFVIVGFVGLGIGLIKRTISI